MVKPLKMFKSIGTMIRILMSILVSCRATEVIYEL